MSHSHTTSRIPFPIRLVLVCLLVWWLLAAVPQSSVLGPLLILTEVARSFPGPLVMAWILGILLALWYRNTAERYLVRCVIVVAFASFAVLAWRVRDFYLLTPRSTPESPLAMISVLVTNAEFGRTDGQKLQKLILQKSPDILIVSEITPEWIKRAGIRADFPFLYEKLGSNAEGTAIYSHHPLHDTTTIRVPNAFYTLAADVQVEGVGTLHLVAIHAPPPQSDLSLSNRRSYFAAMEEHLASVPADVPVIVAGDFNTTPASDEYVRFVRKTGLHNAAHGYGLPSTWPIPGMPMFGAYIDQVLFRGFSATAAIELLPSFGSDHLPVLVRLEVGK